MGGKKVKRFLFSGISGVSEGFLQSPLQFSSFAAPTFMPLNTINHVKQII